ncbi:MAG: hypothetical protein RIB67_07375 [Miltoncostaeaceae bacterium]
MARPGRAADAERVAAWISAEKRPTRKGILIMAWEVEGLISRWSCPLAAEGIGKGAVMCIARAVPRDNWHFILLLHGAEVLRWDVDDDGAARSHHNTACPAHYPRLVTAPRHEHQWNEGLGTHCAVPLFPLPRPGCTHREAWDAFRIRANISGDLRHINPGHPPEPMTLF